MARNFAMANDDGPENKASRAAKDGLVDMSNERIEALRLWSAGQVNIPRRRRIMVSDMHMYQTLWDPSNTVKERRLGVSIHDGHVTSRRSPSRRHCRCSYTSGDSQCPRTMLGDVTGAS